MVQNQFMLDFQEMTHQGQFFHVKNNEKKKNLKIKKIKLLSDFQSQIKLQNILVILKYGKDQN